MNQFIEIRPGRKLRIIEEPNAGKPTLFFIPGLGGRAEQFRAQIDFFKNDYHIIAPDMLGYGQSDKPKNNACYTFAEMSADLQAILERYQTQTNFVVGHSYGGAFAAFLTLNNPSIVNKLVLIAPTALQPKAIPKIFDLPLFLLHLLRPLLDKNFSKLAFHPTTDPNIVATQMAETKKNELYVVKPMLFDMKNLPTVDISKINQPTLILIAGQDGIVPAAESKAFYQAIPRVQFKEINNASHLMMVEQPVQVNQAIKEFITKGPNQQF